jgi:hypothetical protein
MFTGCAAGHFRVSFFSIEEGIPEPISGEKVAKIP